MKNKITAILFCVVFLAACNASVSFIEISNPPGDVQDMIDPNLTLQSISNGKKTTYIVLRSSNDVDADLEIEGKKLNIIFNESNSNHDSAKQYVYKLTNDHNHDSIEVFINGKSTPFDVITVYE